MALLESGTGQPAMTWKVLRLIFEVTIDMDKLHDCCSINERENKMKTVHWLFKVLFSSYKNKKSISNIEHDAKEKHCSKHVRTEKVGTSFKEHLEAPRKCRFFIWMKLKFPHWLLKVSAILIKVNLATKIGSQNSINRHLFKGWLNGLVSQGLAEDLLYVHQRMSHLPWRLQYQWQC